MWSSSRKDSVSTSSNSSEVEDVINRRHPRLLFVLMSQVSICRNNNKNNCKSDSAFTFFNHSSSLFLRFPPERGLGGAATKESAPSLHPLHWRQGRRQQLRRGIHHWTADTHASTGASRALPQRPGQLPGLWLRLWPLLVGWGEGAHRLLRDSCAGAERQSRLSVRWLSAINYTVNECWETGGSRSVFCLSLQIKDWESKSRNR